MMQGAFLCDARYFIKRFHNAIVTLSLSESCIQGLFMTKGHFCAGGSRPTKEAGTFPSGEVSIMS